ncbi:MAG TPA: phage tail sheath subtilisin-like domain-containing protein [Ideonella sp.]|uniref:phage tail sheath subtilisin-like domain-containing protein n=1 Tax=Ideonella sp. TaxID=1929293 RepID=UPI002BDCC8BE|nr:phage tail sheath subtilisin-like domain-containing protein [Ideonella sp.]HSI51445.1 phage tail sheath subtilisin-like domain-containing protein [Ideonella sp.]
MPSYLHPGVYIEEIPSGAKPIEGVSTSVAALIGTTTEGPIGEPVLVHSWDEYKAQFGGIHSETDSLGIDAFNFFLNGGKDAYVARLADNAVPAALAPGKLPGRSGGTADATSVLALRASSAGAWGNQLGVQVTASDSLRFRLVVSRDDAVLESFSNLSMDPSDAAYALTVINGGSRYIRADLSDALKTSPDTYYLKASSQSASLAGMVWTNVTAGMGLTLNIDNLGPRSITLGAAPGGTYDSGAEVAAEITKQVLLLGDAYADFLCEFNAEKLALTSGLKGGTSSVIVRPSPLATLLKLGSANGGVELHGSRDVVPRVTNPALPQALSLGDDGDPPTADTYSSLFTRLKKVRDVNIVMLPGQAMAADGSGNPVIDLAVAHCESTANRMLLVDPPAGTELDDATKVQALSLPTSTYTALYYPWVRIANPFYNRDTNPTAATTLLAAPSAFAAGVWARTDGTRGVWKAPAGVEATVRGMAGLEFQVEDGDQDQLNPEGVNCLRKLPSYGAVLWGTRTLSTKSNPEWRYVPVRRTALYIESSVYNGIQWAVFEPNDHRLWSSLRANVGAFMDGLFRAGAFQGQKASDAYFVRCGLGDTMTQDDVDRGMVIAIVAFAPLKPAEFVIVRIQQKVGQS